METRKWNFILAHIAFRLSMPAETQELERVTSGDGVPNKELLD